jgi:hypothetical protein
LNRKHAKAGSLVRLSVKVATSALAPGVLLALTLPPGVTYDGSKTKALPAQPSPTVDGGFVLWSDIFGAAAVAKNAARYQSTKVGRVGKPLSFTVSVRVKANVPKGTQLAFGASIGGGTCDKAATPGTVTVV